MFRRSVRPVGMRASRRAGGGLSSVNVGSSTPKIVRSGEKRRRVDVVVELEVGRRQHAPPMEASSPNIEIP